MRTHGRAFCLYRQKSLWRGYFVAGIIFTEGWWPFSPVFTEERRPFPRRDAFCRLWISSRNNSVSPFSKKASTSSSVNMMPMCFFKYSMNFFFGSGGGGVHASHTVSSPQQRNLWTQLQCIQKALQGQRLQFQGAECLICSSSDKKTLTGWKPLLTSSRKNVR